MDTVENFESTLKEVVGAKRLSSSKMSKLTKNAMACMENDTQLVSILFRTHKSLSPSSKISSLYVFDALARAARNNVNKEKLTGDLTTQPGNCATFLLKMEGILESLFQDMLSSDHPDAKEKTKKIYDIWVKSNTFPSAVLGRLSKVLKGSGDKGAYHILMCSLS
ncbi:CID domain-containing protein, partial [Abortiporus biennis]